ncbi:MAG: hypothetical protein AAB949_01770 [Patescibacteria group bacterium]
MKASVSSFLAKVKPSFIFASLWNAAQWPNIKQIWRNNKKQVIVAIIALILIGVAGYRFVDRYDINSFSTMKGAVISAAVSSKQFVLDKTKLSTGSSEETSGTETNNEEILSSANTEIGWEVRKTAKGESIWGIYQNEIADQTNISYKNQTINGLKNLTVLKNNISADKLKNNSLTEGQDYELLSEDAQSNYIDKLNEANKQMQDGTKFSDLDKDLQVAYLVANAPSYDFLSRISQDDLSMLLE